MTTAAPTSFQAWGDESGSNSRIDRGTYLMAAVIADSEHYDLLAEEMRGLLPRKEKKVHWHSDAPERHDLVIATIADLPLEAIVVVRQGAPEAERDERRRRKVLEVFAPELQDLGCGDLVLESRGPKDDTRDRKMFDTMRSTGRLSSLRLRHAAGPGDPVLWIADAICGAVVAHRTGHPRWLDLLERKTTMTVIDAG